MEQNETSKESKEMESKEGETIVKGKEDQGKKEIPEDQLRKWLMNACDYNAPPGKIFS